jgi:hypothetical protein
MEKLRSITEMGSFLIPVDREQLLGVNRRTRRYFELLKLDLLVNVEIPVRSALIGPDSIEYMGTSPSWLKRLNWCDLRELG